MWLLNGDGGTSFCGEGTGYLFRLANTILISYLDDASCLPRYLGHGPWAPCLLATRAGVKRPRLVRAFAVGNDLSLNRVALSDLNQESNGTGQSRDTVESRLLRNNNSGVVAQKRYVVEFSTYYFMKTISKRSPEMMHSATQYYSCGLFT